VLAAAAIPPLDEVRAERARRQFSVFVEDAWSIVEPAAPLIPGKHLDALTLHLQAVAEGAIRNLLINVPPGHSKSLVVSVLWPAWMWTRRPQRLEMGGPGWRCLAASYAAELAIRDSVKCRALIESDWYQRSFVADEWELASDQNVKSFFQNTRMGFRVSLSVGGKGTGFRGDAILVDDPLNAIDAHSKAARDAVTLWWDQQMGNRLNDLKKGARVVIMQRLHEEDLSGHLLRQGGWVHLCLPTEFEPKTRCKTPIWEDWRKEAGELLFPELFPADIIAEEKRRLGSLGFAGQHQQRPSPPDGNLFLRSWWKRWHRAGDFVPEGVESRLLPDRFDELLLSVDAAFKATSDSDFVAIGAWGRVGPDKFLLDQVRDRMGFTDTVKALLGVVAKFPGARAKLVEDKANGSAVIDVLKKKVPGIIPVNPEGGKESRAAAVSPEVEAGNVFIPLSAPWVSDYVEECAAFPNGAHDDQVDQTTQALLRFMKRRGGLASLEALAT
jgi:predicted phage terminase large subunit-like protein